MKASVDQLLQSVPPSPYRGPRGRPRETPNGLLVHSAVWLGWLLAAGGTALLGYVVTQAPPHRASWIPLTVGAGFVVTGLLWATSSYALELNWSERSWRETRRWAGWTTDDRRGVFADFEALVLSEHCRPGLTFPRKFWVVSLVARAEPVLRDLFWFSSRPQGQEKLRYLAQKTGLPALDQSQE